MPLPILVYHSVDDSCAPEYRRWAVSPARFRRQLDLLRDRGCRPVTMAEVGASLRDGKPLPDGAVAITFDDGLADFQDGALPLLERYGFASTLFVTTGHVNATAAWLAPIGEGRRRMMSWAEIARLPQRNVECGAHTHSHPELDILPPDAVRHEVRLSKALLEEHLARRVVSFAYPHGYHTDTVAAEVEAAGFLSACGVGSGHGRFGLQRFIVEEDTSDSALHAYLDGRMQARKSQLPQWAMSTLRVGWREYRRVLAPRHFLKQSPTTPKAGA